MGSARYTIVWSPVKARPGGSTNLTELTMNLVARDDVVVAVRESGERTTASGIAIALTVVNDYATVVALGPKRILNDGITYADWDIKVGDTIVVGRDPMNTIKEGGVDYEFYRSRDVVATAIGDDITVGEQSAL